MRDAAADLIKLTHLLTPHNRLVRLVDSVGLQRLVKFYTRKTTMITTKPDLRQLWCLFGS